MGKQVAAGAEKNSRKLMTEHLVFTRSEDKRDLCLLMADKTVNK